MLHVDKKVLHAQFSRNSLEIHSKLVHLYLENLNAIAVQAAIVADLGFGAVKEADYPESSIRGSKYFSYIFYFFALLSFVSSMLALSQSTLCVVFGHTMFLYGEKHEDSLVAIKKIRVHQLESGFWGAVCACSLLLQGCMYTWGVIYSVWNGIIVTVLYIIGIYIIYTESRRTIQMFTPKKELKELGPATALGSNKIATWLGVRQEDEDDTEDNATGLTEQEIEDTVEELKNKIKRKRIRGYVWTKNLSTEDTNHMFSRAYASIENGYLNFYRSKEDYIDLNDPLNEKSFRLRNYVLVTSARELEMYNPPVSTPGMSMLRSITTGTHEMTTRDFMRAKFNVEYAMNRLRFTLAPKSSSELLSLDPIQLMVEDDMSFKQWTAITGDIFRLYAKVQSIQEGDTSKRNVADVKASLEYAHSMRTTVVDDNTEPRSPRFLVSERTVS